METISIIAAIAAILTVGINIALLVTFLKMASNVKKIKNFLMDTDLVNLAKREIELANFDKAKEYLERAMVRRKKNASGSMYSNKGIAEMDQINSLLARIKNETEQQTNDK